MARHNSTFTKTHSFTRWKLALGCLSLGLIVGCANLAGVEDYLLFGIAEKPDNSNTCASEIAITTTNIELVEDGDVTRTYSTVDPYYTDVDAGGDAGMWGFTSVETCVYLTVPFTGTVEIPLSKNSTYSGRLTVLTSYPVAATSTWPGAGAALPSKLTFTSHGVAARQCFTVARVNDAIRNPSEQPFQITTAPITVADDGGKYLAKNACDLTATVEDDEGPGVRVSSISRIMEEPGGGGFNDAQFFVRLRNAPTANVTVPINDLYDATNAGHREGSASPTSLTFTTGNYNVNQAVTITSVDDLEVDGTKSYVVEVQTTSSSDSDYNGIKPRNVVVVNNDQSVPGYTYTRFDATGGNTTAGSGATVTGFATDEMNNMGSTYANFQLKLRSKPSADVTLNFSSNNTAISTVQTTSLTFTPSNWNVNQSVFVIGKSNGTDSATGNGNIDYTVSFTVSTTDTTYNTIPKPSFVIRSCDNDNTHVIQPCNFSGSPYGDSRGRLTGAEPGATTYMWLITKAVPGSAITVPLSSTDTSEGTVPANVTIDSGNYNVLGTGTNRIALSHVDDTDLDGSQNWTVTTGLSSGGLAYDTADVLATTTDNEQKFYINRTGSTNEQDTLTATIDVCLGANNTQSITVNAVCSGDECGVITPSSVTFPPGTTIAGPNPTNALCSSDGNRRTFTIHGANDTFADGSQTFNVNFTVDANVDPVYSSGTPASQTVSNADDEPLGKAIFVSTVNRQGEMTLAGVGGADNFCTTDKPAGMPSGTYKALIVADGATGKRIATTDGSTSAGQVSWVLQPNYHYYRCDSSGYANCSDEHKRLFIANSAGLIPVGAMGMDFSSNTTLHFWTGMLADMTAATQSSTPAKVLDDPDYRHNCAGWTYASAPNSPNPTYYGQTWSRSGAGTFQSNTNVACNETHRLICVQQ